jgi:uncharacterized membrane protein
MNEQLTIFLLSALPLSELRVTIPLAIKSYGLGIFETMFLAVSGVMLAVLIIFLFIDPTVKLMRKNRHLDRAFDWLFDKTRESHGKRMKIWGTVALLLIAITPFPGSGGGWTSSLVAYLFGLNKPKSFFLITIGTIISGLIVLALTEGIASII